MIHGIYDNTGEEYINEHLYVENGAINIKKGIKVFQ